MSITGRLRWLWYLIRRDKVTGELEDEMRLHMELRAEKLRASGEADGANADAEARRRFGNVTGVAEAARDAWGGVSLDQLKQDVRHALRRLHQRPALSIPVLGVLALGIGATTAVFSAVDAAMIRSLPFPRAEALHIVTADIPFDFDRRGSIAGRGLYVTDVAEMRDVFSDVAAYASGGLNLSDPDRPLRVSAGVVTATFFQTLGVRPLHGRTFADEEGKPNGPPVVVLSHGLWERQFGGDDVLGRSLALNGTAHTIVGVMPPGFAFPGTSDLWVPLTVPATWQTFGMFRGYLPSSVVGRLRPGVGIETANARLLSRWEQVIAPATGDYRANLDESLQDVRTKGPSTPLQQQLLGNRRRALLVLFGATLFLLLIACANVANLLLSDASQRRREIAIREVLGATRARIVRQLMIESVLLAVGGAVLGLLLAPVALSVLRVVVPTTLAGVAPARLDPRVLAFAVLLAGATAVLFGLWPACNATRGDASSAIKAGGGHGGTAGGLGKVRAALVVAEVALTIVLLVGAGLMLRSLGRVMSKTMGIRVEQVATLELSFPRAMDVNGKHRILRTAIERLERDPGIAAAGAVNDLPLRLGSGMSITVSVPGAPPPRPGEYQMARVLYASSGYFPAMGIQLVKGRLFEEGDRHAARRVVVISTTMAERYWPGIDPVGRYITWRGDTTPMHVIGVVNDVRERSLEHDPTPQMYQSIFAMGLDNAALVARGTLPRSTMLARVRDAVRGAEPSQAVYNVRMMEDVVGASVALRRANTILIVVFASVALVLSALGVYAVLAYGVTQRMREFGIRAALGATGVDILRLVSRDMVAVVLVGAAIGLLSAWGLSRLMAALLYEVDARDPATFLAVPLVLLLPALVATLVPAWRAVRVSLTTVMREE